MLLNDYLKKYVEVVGRPNLQAAANDETLYVERSSLLVFAQQHAANQKAAEYKKQVNPAPPHSFHSGLYTSEERIRCRRGQGVESDYRKNCNTSNKIQFNISIPTI